MRLPVKAVLPIAVVTLAAACTGNPEPPTQPSATPPVQSPTSAAPEQTPAASAVEPRGEVPLSLPPVEKPAPQGGPWEQTDITVSSADEAAVVSGLPDTFIAYVRSRLTFEDEAGCTPTKFEFTAQHRDGFVFGSEESECGDTFAIWGIEEEEWRYLILFQDPPPCNALTELAVPVDVPALSCEDEEFQVRSY